MQRMSWGCSLSEGWGTSEELLRGVRWQQPSEPCYMVIPIALLTPLPQEGTMEGAHTALYDLVSDSLSLLLILLVRSESLNPAHARLNGGDYTRV